MLSRFFSKLAKAIYATPEMGSLLGRERPYTINPMKEYWRPRFTPALEIVATNKKLFSYEPISAAVLQANDVLNIDDLAISKPLPAVWHSLPSLFSVKSIGTDVAGFGIPFLNRLQIGLFTGLEFVLRTLGVVCAWFQHKLSTGIEKLDLGNKSKNPFIVPILKGIDFVLKSAALVATVPFWCVGQVLMLAADACSYSRQLLDSLAHMINFINPFWQIAKYIKKEPVHSFTSAVKVFVESTLKLLPTAAIIAASVFSAGFATAFIAPIKAAGAALLSGVLSPLAMTIQAAVLVSISGVIASVSRFFSACVRGSFKLAEKPLNEGQRGELVDLPKKVGGREKRALLRGNRRPPAPGGSTVEASRQLHQAEEKARGRYLDVPSARQGYGYRRSYSSGSESPESDSPSPRDSFSSTAVNPSTTPRGSVSSDSPSLRDSFSSTAVNPPTTPRGSVSLEDNSKVKPVNWSSSKNERSQSLSRRWLGKILSIRKQRSETKEDDSDSESESPRRAGK